MIGIIPAAGRGIRFKELGKNYSKTVLPYKEKPILIHQIEWLEKHGCNDIRVVINHASDSVQNVLQMYNKLEIVTLHKQEQRNGLAGAVYSGLFEYDKDEVLILLGDLVVNQQIDKSYFDNNFLSYQNVKDYSRWCMVEQTNENVVFHDKSKVKPNTTKALSGIYFLKSAHLLYNKTKQILSDETNKINDEFQISTVLKEFNDFSLINVDITDFGTLEEYLENRSIKISRSFNDIKVQDKFVVKSSSEEREKIIKEYNWFQNLPIDISCYTPRIFDKELYEANASYTMEKVLSPSLREIYLFLDNSKETWDNIFESLFSLLDKMKEYGQKNTFIDGLTNKTFARYRKIDFDINSDDKKIINEFLNKLSESTNKFNSPCLMHGDFCFSNLLYNFNGGVTMIDPRGELFGDHYYEVAKLFHSIIYDYDFVDAELYIIKNHNVVLYNQGKEDIKKLFLEHVKRRYTEDEINHILIITASLFLSMIPLHSHNSHNQKIYYRIFKGILGEIK